MNNAIVLFDCKVLFKIAYLTPSVFPTRIVTRRVRSQAKLKMLSDRARVADILVFTLYDEKHSTACI